MSWFDSIPQYVSIVLCLDAVQQMMNKVKNF
jgi:hypothetical protein